MPHSERHLQTGDGLRLHENCWLPDGEPRAVVVFVHGFTDHSGRYAGLADALNRRGYAFRAIDLRGHGKSQGRRVFIRSFDEYLDDLDLLLARAGDEHPGTPLFLMGHSMGGSIVLLSAIERATQAAGVVAAAAAVRVGGAVFPLLRHLASAAGRLFPRLRLVAMGCSMLSRDRDVVEAFRNDPLVFHGRFPIRTGAEILRAARQIRRRAGGLRTPLLILHGTDDVITNADGSRLLFEHAAADDKRLEVYDGLYHDLFHEPEKDRLTDDLIAWLDARVERSAAGTATESG